MPIESSWRRVRLTHDAEVVLDLVAGHRTPASRSCRCIPMTTFWGWSRAHGITHRFTRIDGLRGVGGDLKAAYLAAHLPRQSGVHPVRR